MVRGGVLLKDIADRQEVSLKYLSHIISALNTSGIVTNVRRRRGGYVLSRAPSEITAYEVFRALEGSLELVECVDDPKVCDWANFCALRRLCGKLNDSMTSVLQGVTLADLAQEEQGRMGQTIQDNKGKNTPG